MCCKFCLGMRFGPTQYESQAPPCSISAMTGSVNRPVNMQHNALRTEHNRRHVFSIIIITLTI